MRILLVVMILLAFKGTYQDIPTNDYLPTNKGLPPLLRKYKFKYPDIVHHSRARPLHDTGEDSDYAKEKEIEQLLYRRDYHGWSPSNGHGESTVSDQDVNVCHTAVCEEEAKNIKKNMDVTSDPCRDFDQFACGGWRQRYQIPKSSSQITVFTKLWYDEEKVLKELIEKQVDSKDNSSSSLIYNWYSSCMNVTEIANLGSAPLLTLINGLGSCALLKPFLWFPYDWSFLDHLVILNRIDINPFFTILPGTNKFNSSRIILKLFPSSLPLHSLAMYLKRGEYYKAVRLGYLKLMVKLMLKLSRYPVEPLAFKDHILNLYKMDYMLAKARLCNSSSSYQEMTLNRLQEEIPEFPWKKYILRLYTKIPQKKPITGDEIIGVSNLKVLKKIVRVIRRTPKSETANYFIWLIVHAFSNDLSADFEKDFDEFFSTLYGKMQRNSRWRECVASTSSVVAMAVGKLFVEEKFDENSKEKAAKIIEAILHELIKNFNEVSWMDAETTRKAEEKADAIVKNIAYPEFVLNETLLQQYYSGLSFHPRRFFGNIIHHRVVIIENTLRTREYRPNRKRWSMSPQQVNAYYAPSYNKIVFPAAILQTPFWHADFPMSLQFAGLGFIAGHEISHGFDATGMNYDKHGNYHNWWTNSSLKAFELKARCLRDQYSNYTIFGKNINGKLTLCENIADNAGLHLAYQAYKDWVKKNGTDQRLPGLSFNSDQLFFVKGAQIWCANLRKKSTLNTIDTDEHTPKMFRTIGTLSNSVEFSTAFNCPVGSKMNPGKKCRIWQ